MPIVDESGAPQVDQTYARAKESLDRARNLEGEEARALLEQSFRDLVWLWEESATHCPPFVGVRSSFMLTSVRELAERYPPTADYVDQEICRLRALVEEGTCNDYAFFDLIALDRDFTQLTHSASSMRIVLALQPELAERIGPKLWETWLAASDWELFEAYAPDPTEVMEDWVEMFRRYEKNARGSDTGYGSEHYKKVKLRANKRRFDELHQGYIRAGLSEYARTLLTLKSNLAMTE